MPDEHLLRAFENGTLEPAAFLHESHLRVAWLLNRRYGREEGLGRLIAGLRSLAARAGNPGAYHETITRAWFELVASADDLDAHHELLDRGLLARYYSAEALESGRDRWVEPDLKPLPA